jgi:hypothetical protein
MTAYDVAQKTMELLQHFHKIVTWDFRSSRMAQIPHASSPGRLNFFVRRLVLFGPVCANRFMSLSGALCCF